MMPFQYKWKFRSICFNPSCTELLYRNMMTSSYGKYFLCYWPFVTGICRSPMDSPRKGQWRGALMFSLICVCTNGWTNNQDAGILIYWFIRLYSWWRHQMETFSTFLALCVGNSPFTSEFRSQRPLSQNFVVLLDLRLNKRLSKQSRRWWFGAPSHSLWRHGNVFVRLTGIRTINKIQIISI